MGLFLALPLAFLYTGLARASPPMNPLTTDQPAVVAAVTGKTKCGATYRVRPGDTLSRIARRCGVTVAELQQANNLSPRARLLPGRVLRIPRRIPSADNGQVMGQTTIVTAAAPVLPTPTAPPDLRKHYLPTPSLGN